MREYVVFFWDGSSVDVWAYDRDHAIAKARRVFPARRVSSVQHAHRQYS